MRVVTALVAAAPLVSSIAASAQATVREKLREELEWSFVEDCGFPVEVTGSGSAVFVLREGKNKDSGAFRSWTDSRTRRRG